MVYIVVRCILTNDSISTSMQSSHKHQRRCNVFVDAQKRCMDVDDTVTLVSYNRLDMAEMMLEKETLNSISRKIQFHTFSPIRIKR